jgi:hypothetical protein
MKLESYKDIIDLAKYRIGEIDEDEEIEYVIKNAINQSYLFDLSKIEERLSTSFISVVNGVATLPDDLNAIVEITPKLISGEYRRGNAIVSKREGTTFTLVYSIIPEPLVNDTDVPDLSSKAKYLLATYACFSFYTYKKKAQMIDVYYGEYQRGINELKIDDDNYDIVVQDVYEVSGDGE